MPLWLRVHSAHVPDYNRQAAVYWWTMVACGLAILTQALVVVAAKPSGVWLQVGVGMVIAILAGIFPVRVRQSKNSFVAGEIFIFLLLLMHGPSAAAIAAAGDAFVARLANNINEAAVVQSIILLGSSLGKLVVAEGIETPAQREQLREMGCSLGQGYLLSRPLEASRISDMLALRQPRPANAAARFVATTADIVLE
jgi:hypothetical protein